MDFVKNLSGGDTNDNRNNQNISQRQQQQQQSPQSSLGGFVDSIFGGDKKSAVSEEQPAQKSPLSSTGGYMQSFLGGKEDTSQEHTQKSSGGFMDSVNSALGGGRNSEKNEDFLDKAVDFVQEKFLGQGPQDNESALEQAKDEQISDFLRAKIKSATGRDLPFEDK
jgi:hypothetical protein